jgi:hypothetical protein
MNKNDLTNNICNSDEIKRIRFAHNQDGTCWYGFSKSIKLDEKSSSSAGIDKYVPASNNWCDLTDRGRKMVNAMIDMKGIRYVNASAFGVTLEKEAVYTWSDFHAEIILLLNQTLFAGAADVAELGARKLDEGLISWSGTRKDTVRWYGVSTSLKIDSKNKSSAVITSPIDQDNWCGLTEEALIVVNSIYSMKGVFTLWVSPFDLSIEIAPIFSWSDYHNQVIELLTDHILGGKAFVEQR